MIKSLEQKYNEIRNQNPNYSSYLCFRNAVIGSRYCPVIIKRRFNRLVDKADYDKKDKKC